MQDIENRRNRNFTGGTCRRKLLALVLLATFSGTLLAALRLGGASSLRVVQRTVSTTAASTAAMATEACNACNAICRPHSVPPDVACPSPQPFESTGDSLIPTHPASPVPAPTLVSATRHGLERLLSDNELDTFFRIDAELHDNLFGTTDVTFLAPYLARVAGAFRAEHGAGADGLGGIVDVGANIGGATDAMLGAWSDHAMRFYMHVVGSDDALHSAYNNERLAFVFVLEAAPKTLALLRRRAEASRWPNSNVHIFAAAASNASGTARFCSSAAGSEQGGIGLEAAAAAGGECAVVEAVTVTDLVNRESLAGPTSRLFFLKIDVEGFEALVLAGAARLFAAQRISFVLFENHAKWRQAQEAAGVAPFISVGAAVRALIAHGYRCYYLHARGLVPFVTEGTPAGEAARPVAECHEGLPFCARWRLYDRQFWSNVFCGAPATHIWLDWLADAAVSPTETRDKLLRRE